MKACSALLLLILAGCSSVPVEGTYSVLGKRKAGTCGETGSAPTTWTITALDSGYTLEFPGITGGCALREVDGDSAKLQGKCSIDIGDATTSDRTATLQYLLTFDAAGFKGSVAIHIPPAKSASACDGENTLTGTRQ